MQQIHTTLKSNKRRNLNSAKSYAIFSCKFLVVHIIPTRTGELNSHHQQGPLWAEDIHTTGCCPVPRRDRLRHCYLHLSAMQPSARCLAPCLQWTSALFAVLGRYPPPQRGRLGLNFGGEDATLILMQIDYLTLHFFSLQIFLTQIFVSHQSHQHLN
jgi:hypothetical protein